jgi:hypothetical protein
MQEQIYEVTMSDQASTVDKTLTATDWEDAKIEAELLVEEGDYGNVIWHSTRFVDGNPDWSMWEVRITLKQGSKSKTWSVYAEEV